MAIVAKRPKFTYKPKLPPRYWHKRENRRAYFNWTIKHLLSPSLYSMESLYNLSYEQVIASGGMSTHVCLNVTCPYWSPIIKEEELFNSLQIVLPWLLWMPTQSTIGNHGTSKNPQQVGGKSCQSAFSMETYTQRLQ